MSSTFIHFQTIFTVILDVFSTKKKKFFWIFWKIYTDRSLKRFKCSMNDNIFWLTFKFSFSFCLKVLKKKFEVFYRRDQQEFVFLKINFKLNISYYSCREIFQINLTFLSVIWGRTISFSNMFITIFQSSFNNRFRTVFSQDSA